MGVNFQILTQPNNDCGCNTYKAQAPDKCCDGALYQWDFKDIIYHKSNNNTSELDGLGLTNGATLELVIETVDEKIKGLKVLDFNLPILRANGNIVNTPQQFAQSVDTQIGILQSRITTVENNSAVPLSVTDSPTIDFVTSGLLNHSLTGTVRISASTNNTVIATTDGIFGVPQTLSVDYTAKKLTLSNANTVDLSSLVCGASGFLGNVTSDPVALIDGQYWFNTSQQSLKIRLNGAVREISLV